jgi:hypothetical protein
VLFLTNESGTLTVSGFLSIDTITTGQPRVLLYAGSAFMANLIVQLKTLWYFLDGRSQRQHYSQASSIFYCNPCSLPLMWEEGMGGVA